MLPDLRPKILSPAANDLGLGEKLMQSVTGETEEEKRLKMRRAPGVGALGSAAVMDLFGKAMPNG